MADRSASVTICIIHESGTYYTTAESLQAVQVALESGGTLPVWWFAPNGQRFREDMWFSMEGLSALRTERDDG